MGALTHGDYAAQQLSRRVAEPVASLTALKTMSARQRATGMLALNLADGKTWRYSSASTLTGDDLLVATPSDSAGRWLLAPGAVLIQIPITFATLDAAVLLTMPAGALLKIDDLFWRVTTNFSGGTSSAIGVSSTKTAPTNWSTKGDLLGGSAGDVAATLVSATGIVAGTVGTDMDTVAKRRGAIWKAADILRFDRITDAFTAGVGAVCVSGTLLENNGA
jgi:hypothetical protein